MEEIYREGREEEKEGNVVVSLIDGLYLVVMHYKVKKDSK